MDGPLPVDLTHFLLLWDTYIIHTQVTTYIAVALWLRVAHAEVACKYVLLHMYV